VACDNIWLFNLLGKSNTSIGVRDEDHISDIAIMELLTQCFPWWWQSFNQRGFYLSTKLWSVFGKTRHWSIHRGQNQSHTCLSNWGKRASATSILKDPTESLFKCNVDVRWDATPGVLGDSVLYKWKTLVLVWRTRSCFLNCLIIWRVGVKGMEIWSLSLQTWWLHVKVSNRSAICSIMELKVIMRECPDIEVQKINQ
jgi:hypothetical protein